MDEHLRVGKPKSRKMKSFARLQKKLRKMQVMKSLLGVYLMNEMDTRSVRLDQQRQSQAMSTSETENDDHAQSLITRFNLATDWDVSNGKPVGESQPEDKCTEEEYNVLRKEISERVKKKKLNPVLFMKSAGCHAQFDWRSTPNERLVPLTVQDIGQFLLLSLFGDGASCKQKWCTLVRPNKISHVVLVLVQGLSSKDFSGNAEAVPGLHTLFYMAVEVKTSERYAGGVIEELILSTFGDKSQVHLKAEEHNKESDKHQGISNDMDSSENTSLAFSLSPSDRFSRVSLLLSPEEMILEGYPLPIPRMNDGFECTKEKYSPVNSFSPLYAVDCEMCLTTAGCRELTRISIVDEQMCVIYDKLVKPHNEITDYCTDACFTQCYVSIYKIRGIQFCMSANCNSLETFWKQFGGEIFFFTFSGITAEILENVDTRLSDVQQKVCKLLPSDAILCGHSLNFDLSAMKVMHPYVIDTSVIYNVHGTNRKPRLRDLAKLFLNEEIQSKSSGHDSIQDSRAVMKLVKLKLINGISFGDRIKDPRSISISAINYNHETIDVITQLEKTKKKVSVISSFPMCNGNLVSSLPASEHIHHYLYQSNEEVVEHTREMAIDSDFSIVYLDFENHKKKMKSSSQVLLSELDKYCNNLCESFAPNSLCILMCGNSFQQSKNPCTTSNGLCMVTLKPPLK